MPLVLPAGDRFIPFWFILSLGSFHCFLLYHVSRRLAHAVSPQTRLVVGVNVHLRVVCRPEMNKSCRRSCLSSFGNRHRAPSFECRWIYLFLYPVLFPFFSTLFLSSRFPRHSLYRGGCTCNISRRSNMDRRSLSLLLLFLSLYCRVPITVSGHDH